MTNDERLKRLVIKMIQRGQWSCAAMHINAKVQSLCLEALIDELKSKEVKAK